MSETAIETSHVVRSFGAVRALNDVSFAVPAGIVFGFLGTNGAGKTTMIRLLLGLLEPTSGGATVLGLDPRTQGQQIRAQSGALLEHTGLYERLTAADNLEFYGRVWRLSARERQARARELLTHLGLWDRRADRVGTWSRGMRQKLAIARVLLHRPKLVFLDEPTDGLDPLAAAAVRHDIAALAAHAGATVFLTTHNLAEAERLCALVGIIRQGTLLAVGSPDELRRRTGRPQVEVVGTGFSDALLAMLGQRPDVARVQRATGRVLIDLRGSVPTAPIVRALVGAGAQIDEVHRGQATLEDAFLALVEDAHDPRPTNHDLERVA